MPEAPAAAPAAGPDAGLLPPASATAVFIGFTAMALQGFGGMFTVMQRELVERRRWITAETFLEDNAAAQVMPGPNACNLAIMVGRRFFGWRGAFAAVLGLLLAPIGLVLLLAGVQARFQDHAAVQGALRGMSAVAAGAIMASGVKLVPALRHHPLGRPAALGFSVAAAVLVAFFRLPVIGVLAVVGGLACFATWKALKR
jgi:chromate transporter